MFYHSRKKIPRKGESSGVMGDPTVASRETGEKVVLTVVGGLVEIIVGIVKSGKTGP